MRWIIFYEDGSRFTSSHGSWKQAPDQGVQAVMTWPTGGPRTIWDGCDAYWLDRGKMCMVIARERHLEQLEVDGAVLKRGKEIDPDRYAEIREEALKARKPRR